MDLWEQRLLGKFAGLQRLPLTSISELASEAIILFQGLARAVRALVDKVRLVRWRREYEVSVNRLIQSIERCNDGYLVRGHGSHNYRNSESRAWVWNSKSGRA